MYATAPGPSNVYWIDTKTNKASGALSFNPTYTETLPIAYDPANSEMYMGLYNFSSQTSTVVVIDSLSNTAVALIGPIPGDVAAIAYDPLTTQMLVTQLGNNTVSMIDSGGNSVTQAVPVGSGPFGLAFDPAGGTMYVADSNSNNTTVLDANTGSPIASLQGESEPLKAAFDPAMGRMCVTNWAAATVACYGDRSFTPALTTTLSGSASPYYLAYDSANQELYTGTSTSNVTVINGSSGHFLTNVSVGNLSIGVAYAPSNGDIYVGTECLFCTSNGSVVVINGSTNTVVNTGIPVGAVPYGVAYDPANHDIYVADKFANNVSVISTVTNTVVATIAVGGGPWGLGYDPVTKTMFVSNEYTSNVTVISATNTVVATVAVGAIPLGIAYDPMTRDLYVAALGISSLSVINAKTMKFVGSDGLFGTPVGVAYDPVDQYLYVALPNSGAPSSPVEVVTGSGTPIATVVAGHSPINVVFDAASNLVWVTNRDSSSLTAIIG